jgi:hypothetical protein
MKRGPDLFVAIADWGANVMISETASQERRIKALANWNQSAAILCQKLISRLVVKKNRPFIAENLPK